MRGMTVIAGIALMVGVASAGAPKPPASPMSAAQAQKVVDGALSEQPDPDLMIGDKAPKIEAAGWVQGERSKLLEKGAITVVECWATWCGPCIAQIPHLDHLYEEYKDKVNFTGVHVWERNIAKSEIGPTVKTFVQAKNTDGLMHYPVAWDSGKIADDLLKPTNTNGIPAAFIFDEDGHLAWTGHPAEMDGPLAKIVEGDWNLEKAREEYRANAAASAMYRQVMISLMDAGKADEGYELAEALTQTLWKDNPGVLNAVSWGSLTSPRVAKRNTAFAVRAANRAAEATNWEDASIIDTLARAWWDHGDKEAGIELQELAVKQAKDDRSRTELEKTLEKYRAEMDG